MKTKVLTVDDEEILRILVREVLESEGYEVAEAASGQELRACFTAPAPALVILDLNLPDGSGLSLLPELKQHWPTTKVLILTGYGTVQAAEAAYQIDDVFLQSKPFDAEMLKAMVAMALAQKPSGAATAAKPKGVSKG